MNIVFVLEWTFSPPNYFEEPIHIVRDQYELKIDNGKVEAKVKAEFYDDDHKIRGELHEFLNDRFLGVQLTTHKPYELSKPGVYKLYPDGRRDLFVFAESAIMVFSVGEVDLIVTDKEGQVVADSRRERIEKKKTVADLAEKYRSIDTVSASILDSYHKAVIDPSNELVHLYEIRDALVDKFGGESKTIKILDISKTEWRRFGYLANEAPLKQGRHRGKNVGLLRDATHAELNEAREFSLKLVIAYFEYLEQNR